MCVSTVVCVSVCVSERARTHMLLLCANKCTYRDTSFSHAESKNTERRNLLPKTEAWRRAAGPHADTGVELQDWKGGLGIAVYSSERSSKETGL